MGDFLKTVFEGVSSLIPAQDPNNPLPTPPPSFIEYPLAFLGGIGQHPKAGPVTRGLSGLSGFAGQEMARRRNDPLDRVLPVAERVIRAIGDVNIPGAIVPSQTIPEPPSFTGVESQLPPVPPNYPAFQSSRKAVNLAEARPHLSPQITRELAALQLFYPQTVQREDLFIDPLKEQQRQLGEIALKKGPIEIREAARKETEAIAQRGREDRARELSAQFMSTLQPTDKDYAQKAVRGLTRIAAQTGAQDVKGLITEFLNLNTAEINLEIQKSRAAELANYRKITQSGIEARAKIETELKALNQARLVTQTQIADIDKKMDLNFGSRDKEMQAYLKVLEKRRVQLTKKLREIEDKASSLAGVSSDEKAKEEFRKAMQGMLTGYSGE